MLMKVVNVLKIKIFDKVKKKFVKFKIKYFLKINIVYVF